MKLMKIKMELYADDIPLSAIHSHACSISLICYTGSYKFETGTLCQSLGINLQGFETLVF